MHFKTSHDSNVRALTGWTWLKRLGELWMAKKPSRLSWGPVHSAVLWDQSCRNFRKVESGPHFSTSDVDPSPGFVIDPWDPRSYDIIRATWIISGIVIWESLKIIMKNEVSWTWLLFVILFCHCPWQWASYPVHESTTVAVSYTPSFEHPLNHPVLVLNMRILCPGLLFQHVSTASILEELCLQRAKRSTDFK